LSTIACAPRLRNDKVAAAELAAEEAAVAVYQIESCRRAKASSATFTCAFATTATGGMSSDHDDDVRSAGEAFEPGRRHDAAGRDRGTAG